MKKLSIFIVLVASLLIWSCSNSSKDSNKNLKSTHQSITSQMIIGEWECVDIFNGVTHMKNIAKMQPHMVFTADGKILSKMVLPDGSSTEQKLDVYKIVNGKISSKAFDADVYIENDKLIVEDPSADNKRIYIKK